MMNNKYKYISYRKDREKYKVEMRIDGHRVVRLCDTLMEAVQVRTMLERQKRAGIYTVRKQAEMPSTLQEAFEQYRIKAIEPTDMACTTKDRYRYDANKVNAYFGMENPAALTAIQWENLFRMWLAQGRDYKHVRDCMSRYRSMYAYYQRMNCIEDNPIEHVVLRDKHGLAGKEQKPCFTEKEKAAFLSTAKHIYGWSHWFLWYMYFATGCRRGELLACTWDDVDEEHMTLHIGHSITRGTVNGEFKEFVGRTKTPQSIRDIPLSREIMAGLHKLKLATGLRSKYIFYYEDDYGRNRYEWVSLTAVQRWFARIRRNAPIRQELTIHSIRHYFATRLVAAGVDLKTVQALGGWSTPEVLLNNYASADPKKMRETMLDYLGLSHDEKVVTPWV